MFGEYLDFDLLPVHSKFFQQVIFEKLEFNFLMHFRHRVLFGSVGSCYGNHNSYVSVF